MSKLLGPCALFLFLVGVSLFFFRGTLELPEERLHAFATKSFVETLSLVFARDIEGHRSYSEGAAFPALGSCAFLVDRTLRAGDPQRFAFSLLPLTNVVLFGLMGALLSLLLEGGRRFGAVALVLIASPLLPASLVYTNTLAGTTAVVAMAVILFRSRPHHPSAAVLGALAGACAVMTDVALLPHVLIVIVWGLRENMPRGAVIGCAVGAALGMAGIFAQGHLMHGDAFLLFREAYPTVAPLLAQLPDRLFSPDAGVLLLFPACLLPLVSTRITCDRTNTLVMLGFALLAVGVLLPSSGSMTILPGVAILCAGIAELVFRNRQLEPTVRTLLWLALGWSAFLNVIECTYSAFQWSARLAEVGENVPTLWQAWLDGVPLPSARPDFSPTARAVLLATAICSVALSAYPLLQPFRGHVGMDPEARDEVRRAFLALGSGNRSLRDELLRPGPLVVLFLILWLSSILALLSGPKGWQATTSPIQGRRFSHLLLTDQNGRFETLLDLPRPQTIWFTVQANAVYRLSVNNLMLLEETESEDRETRQVSAVLAQGYNYLEVEVFPPDAYNSSTLDLFWTLGGERGRVMAAGGDRTMPRGLRPAERFFREVNRWKWWIFGAYVALQLLIRRAPISKDPDLPF